MDITSYDTRQHVDLPTHEYSVVLRTLLTRHASTPWSNEISRPVTNEFADKFDFPHEERHRDEMKEIEELKGNFMSFELLAPTVCLQSGTQGISVCVTRCIEEQQQHTTVDVCMYEPFVVGLFFCSEGRFFLLTMVNLSVSRREGHRCLRMSPYRLDADVRMLCCSPLVVPPSAELSALFLTSGIRWRSGSHAGNQSISFVEMADVMDERISGEDNIRFAQNY
ncbi:Hypothetical protein SMAX5B_003234 [Scophthalmus maximus]|uniref:Uncharacterized protein n=1 Tax=Scophthalmus maximus TaxID=52904 RepID=A0A2U9BDG7_SCOMX|nr:Hypothetical protein SMAX5B_003234 [Scophthalmus maximus]